MAAREPVPSVSLVLPAATLDAARRLAGFTDGLDAEAVALLAKRLHHVSLPAGGLLYRQGEIGDAVYFVRSGRMAVLVTRDDWREIRVAEAGPDEVIGEMALVSAEPRMASARALRDCGLLRFSKAAYEALLSREPDALEPFVQVMTDRVARAARISQAMFTLRSSSPVTLEECAAVVSITDPRALDTGIRRLYHRMAADLTVLLGAQDANWFAFASRSSTCAGLPSRDDLPVLPLSGRVVAALLPDAAVANLQRRRVVEDAAAVLDRLNARVAEGVRGLVAEIVPAFVQLIAECADELDDLTRTVRQATAPAPQRVDRREDLLGDAVRAYNEAAAEPDEKVRAELVLLGTTKLALFEQQRLEGIVTEAIDEAVADSLSADGGLASVPRWLRGGTRARRFVRRLLSRLVWSRLVRIRLPDSSLRSGSDLPPASGRRPPPGALAVFANEELAALVARFDRGRGTRPIDWTDPADRMRYLVTLFRAHQRRLELFEPPFAEGSNS